MHELYNLGLNDKTIETMIEMNEEIKDITSQELKEKQIILKKVKCTENQIINIISSNSMFLTRTTEEILKLIGCLTKYGFDTLNILFDSNPYILNLEPFEIENYINERIENGEELEEIIDDLDSNPYLFNEI